LPIEINKDNGTKVPAEAGACAPPLPPTIVSAVRKFKNLSDQEKLDLEGKLESLNAKGFNMRRFATIFTSLREEEAKIAIQVVEKQLVSLLPVQMKSMAVHQPLMSGYTLGKEDLEIFLPTELEPYADHGLILELFRYKGSVDNVKFTRVRGTIKIPNEDRLSTLIMGYITELLSDQKIAKIQYSKSSYYQLGRMLARAKLLQLVANDKQIPQKYLVVPSRFYGGTAEFKEPEVTRTLRSLVADDVNLLDDLLRNLAAHVYKTQADKVRNKIDSSLFIPFAEFVHMHERRAKKESKSKKGKTTLSYTTIKATKPSVLATVAPWERDAVAELYDTAWADLQNLELEFKKTPALEINYNEMSHKLTHLIEKQWFDKQSVLRKTNKRTAMSSVETGAPLWRKLNDTKSILVEFKTMEAVPEQDLFLLSPYMLLPTGNVTLPDGYTAPYSVAFKQGKLADKFPCMSMLISTYEKLLEPIGGIPPA
jgi:hypothetical protein